MPVPAMRTCASQLLCLHPPSAAQPRAVCGPPDLNPMPPYALATADRPGALQTPASARLLLQFFFSGVVLWLVLRALWCVAGNITVNELACRGRYEHLQDARGDFINRFDAGPAANCLQFWTSGLTEWRAARQPDAVVYNAAPGMG